ncbi:cytochrome c biogenesis protein ResB [Virgibacillus xinjiangensis]|uniref:Cytochrome c biogenesis protein ResB n=1 Tax=Virgibacillus xinjiangensis TaxID=393090 RepID=A0ABV7CRB8_9BACI
MNKIKCECGHVNPEGTVLCEACGKPIEKNQHIDGNNDKKLLNMRYDGSARRSQTYNKSIIDKIWSFFSSVKVGVWLIVITLIASAVGSIFPQEMYIPADAENRDPSVFYEDRYGIFGLIYYQLGLHNLYSSWWYMLLIALIGISLVICSIDRVVPLYKALKIQKAKRHETFISRQRLYSESSDVSKDELQTVKDRLKNQRYRVRDEDGHILAEKNRFSRWGPYVNHIGLIIILIAAILRFSDVLYLDEYVWVREGETTVLPGTNSEYYIENKDFVLETHDADDERFREAIAEQGEVFSNFQTNVVIYQAKESSVPGGEPELEPVLEEEIRMNHPAKFDEYSLYQAGYQTNEFHRMSFKIHEMDDPEEEAIAEFTVDLTSPDMQYELANGFRVEIAEYFPDYYLDEEGEPASETNYPRNPAFVMIVHPPGEEEPEVSFLGIGRNLDATGENDYNIGITDVQTRNVSGLTVRVDHTLPLFGLGATIFMIGVIQGMYWHHRRIWLHPKDNGVLMAAHTNKNWFGVQKDIEKAIDGTNINMVKDQQELDEEK